MKEMINFPNNQANVNLMANIFQVVKQQRFFKENPSVGKDALDRQSSITIRKGKLAQLN